MTNLEFLGKLKNQVVDLQNFKNKFMTFGKDLEEFEQYINSQTNTVTETNTLTQEKEEGKKLELSNNQNAA